MINKHHLPTKAKIKQPNSTKLKGDTNKKLYRSLTVKCSEIAMCGNMQNDMGNTI